MAENNENDLPTDGSEVFGRDPINSDIVKNLAEQLGITPEEACKRCGLKRPCEVEAEREREEAEWRRLGVIPLPPPSKEDIDAINNAWWIHRD